MGAFCSEPHTDSQIVRASHEDISKQPKLKPKAKMDLNELEEDWGVNELQITANINETTAVEGFKIDQNVSKADDDIRVQSYPIQISSEDESTDHRKESDLKM